MHVELYPQRQGLVWRFFFIDAPLPHSISAPKPHTKHRMWVVDIKRNYNTDDWCWWNSVSHMSRMSDKYNEKPDQK